MSININLSSKESLIFIFDRIVEQSLTLRMATFIEVVLHYLMMRHFANVTIKFLLRNGITIGRTETKSLSNAN